MDSLAEPSCGSGIFFGAPTVPECPKGGVRGVSWIWALSLDRGEGVRERGGSFLLGIINALCSFPTEGAMPDHCGDLEGLGGVEDEVVAVHEEGEVVGVIALLGDDHGVREQRRGPEVIKEKPQGRHGSWTERGVKMKNRIVLIDLRGTLAQVEISLQLSHMSMNRRYRSKDTHPHYNCGRQTQRLFSCLVLLACFFSPLDACFTSARLRYQSIRTR